MKIKGRKKLLMFCVLFLCVSIAVVAQDCASTQHKGTGLEQGKRNNSAKDHNGPTVLLSYREGFKKNPIASFMYFVPLISPTLVDRENNTNNKQYASLIACERKISNKDFYVACEFQMAGDGFHKNTFDAEGMIERNIGALKGKKPLKDILDYIKFEGQGYGRIEIKGKIINDKKIVTKVDVHFNERGGKSPVTIGIYSVKPVNGKYKYENRYNMIFARVNTLTFKRSEQTPKMAIRLASVSSDKELNGVLGCIKGAIANLFIKPLEVDKSGNNAMLDFGLALFKAEPTFTFPKAKNLKDGYQ